MANALNNSPMVIDTDFASYRTAASQLQGIRVAKLILAVGPGGASSAGTVSITAPSDSSLLYPPLVVQSAQAANTVLYVDDPAGAPTLLTWRDFAVTGVTATGTRLFIWWRV